MFLIKVTESFEAAHALLGYDGPCAQTHGHCWQVTATWKVPDQLDKSGISVDLVYLKSMLRSLLKACYDHSFLNNRLHFQHVSPSAENIAQILYSQLQAEAAMQKGAEQIVAVEIEETRGCRVIYTEGKTYESV